MFVYKKDRIVAHLYAEAYISRRKSQHALKSVGYILSFLLFFALAFVCLCSFNIVHLYHDDMVNITTVMKGQKDTFCHEGQSK